MYIDMREILMKGRPGIITEKQWAEAIDKRWPNLDTMTLEEFKEDAQKDNKCNSAT